MSKTAQFNSCLVAPVQGTKFTTLFTSLKARPVPMHKARAASQPRRPLARGSLSSSQGKLSRDSNMVPMWWPSSYLLGGFNPFERSQSNWNISPARGKNKKYFKPLHSYVVAWFWGDKLCNLQPRFGRWNVHVTVVNVLRRVCRMASG